MPSTTFNNLTKIKKNKIFEAGFTEFSNNNFNDASVNNIVSKAEIPKGSFYQYFKDKEEFYWYIIDRITSEQISNYDKILEGTNGNFVKAEEHLFFHFAVLLENDKYRNLIRNVFDTSYFDITKRLISSSGIDYDIMYGTLYQKKVKIVKKMTKDDFIIAFEMMRDILNNSIISLISLDLNTQDAISFYQKRVNFLLNGIA